MASQEIVTMECFQWINRLMLNTRYLHNIYTASSELAGTNQKASGIGLIYVFISSRIELH